MSSLSSEAIPGEFLKEKEIIFKKRKDDMPGYLKFFKYQE